MAPRTHVQGNKVQIDENVYLVSPAGAGQYSVADDFGGRLGYFRVNGKAVSAEDYGVEGAHPILQIGRLWVLAQAAGDQKGKGPATKGVCRVAVHENVSEVDLGRARDHRAWMKKQTGCLASYFVLDPATGKSMSISIWDNRGSFAALKGGTPPGDAAEPAAISVDFYPIVEQP